MIVKTIEELRQDLDSKKVTSAELVKESLELAHKYQEEYNSFVTICDDASGEETTGILSGIPCAIKDNLSTKGVLTTASSNILKLETVFPISHTCRLKATFYMVISGASLVTQ